MRFLGGCDIKHPMRTISAEARKRKKRTEMTVTKLVKIEETSTAEGVNHVYLCHYLLNNV